MRVYHGTQYHKSIENNGFDPSKSYKQRNDKLGAGEAVYFSYDYSIASDYSMANANDTFHPCIIEELKETDQMAAFLLEGLYKYGTENAWENLAEEYGWDVIGKEYENKDYDLNDVQHIAEYIRGSKVLEEEDYLEESVASLFGGGSSGMPYAVREDAKKMGIKTIPSDYGKVISCRLAEDSKIKKIGQTSNANMEAKIAREEGYHGIEFINQYSVDNGVELALFDVTKIEILNLIEEIKPWQDTTIDTVKLVFESIDSGKSDLFNVLEEVFHPGVVKNNKFESIKYLKNILGAMAKIGLIEGSEQNIETSVKKEEIETVINDCKLPIVSELKKSNKIGEVEKSQIKKDTSRQNNINNN